MHKDLIDLSRKYARAKPLSSPKIRDQIILIVAVLTRKRCQTLKISIEQTRTRIIENTDNNIFDTRLFILLDILNDTHSKFTNFFTNFHDSITNIMNANGNSVSLDMLDAETRITVFKFVIRYGTRCILRLSNGAIISQENTK